jgi:hypothetical protein
MKAISGNNIGTGHTPQSQGMEAQSGDKRVEVIIKSRPWRHTCSRSTPSLPCPDIIYYIYKYIRKRGLGGTPRATNRGIISGNFGAADFSKWHTFLVRIFPKFPDIISGFQA